MQLAVAFGASMLGSALGVPQLGWLVGSVAGAFLLGGNKQKNATKLSDLKVSSSTYGKGIPEVWGTMRCTGNMIWATDIDERKKYIGPKGKDKTGKKKADKKGTEVYEYYGNFAMALCKGPMEDVLRIWCDSNLIYDKLNPDNEDLVSPGFSQADGDDGGKLGLSGAKKGSGSQSGRWNWRFYPGNEEQTQDPFMIEKQGADKVPAFRGLCYLMFEDFPLQDFGNRIPTITAEVVSYRDRKLRLVEWPYLDDDTADFPINNGRYDHYSAVDPIRMRLYEIRTHDCHVFDLNKGREIRRFRIEGNFLGIGADGDLVVKAPGSSNSQPIRFLDPNSGAIKYVIGTYSSSTYLQYRHPAAGDGLIAKVGFNIPWAMEAVTVPYLTLTGALEYGTAIRTIFGQMVWAKLTGSLNYGPMEPFCTNTQLGGIHRLVPGYPLLNGALFYAITRNRIVEYNSTLMEFPYDNPFGFGVHAGQTGLSVEFPDPVDGTVTIDTPIFSVGADAWIVPYEINTGAQAGFYVAKYDKEFKRRVWTKRLCDYRFLGMASWRHPYNPTPLVEGDKWACLYDRQIIQVNIKAETFEIYEMPSSQPYVGGFHYYFSAKNAILYWGAGFGGGAYRWWWLEIDKYAQVPTEISEICRDVCVEVGIDDAKLDFTDLDSEKITGYILESPTAARNVLEDLTRIYQFDVVESDYKLKFRSRGRASVTTLHQMDLGIIDRDRHDFYKETRTQEIDLPQTVVVSYVDSENDYQTGSQHYRRPISPVSVMQSREQVDVNLPIAMKADVAKKMAQMILFSTWAERVSHEFILPWDYLIYDPTDVFTFVMDDGLTFVDRLLKADVGADYTLEVGSVQQVASTYSPDGIGVNSGGVIPLRRYGPPLVRPLVLDTPFHEDGDLSKAGTDFTMYWAAGPYDSGFRAGSIWLKDDQAGWKIYDSAIVEGIWGYTFGPIGAPANGPFATDDKTTITLIPSFDYTTEYLFNWESIPDEEWPSEANMVLVGDEIILFKDVVVNADRSITISTLIRGARGTERHATATEDAKRWVLLSTEGIRMISMAESNVDHVMSAKMTSLSQFQALAPQTSFTYTAAAQRPWAPNDIRRVDSGGDVTITWERRTRANGGLKNGQGTVPNYETNRYRVLILDKEYDPSTFVPSYIQGNLVYFNYVREAEVTSEEFVFTADMIAESALLGFDWDITQPLWVAVYQMSDEVGYGFPAIVKLDPTAPPYS